MELFRENIQSAPSQGAMDFWEDWESSSQPKVLGKAYPHSLSLPTRIEAQHKAQRRLHATIFLIMSMTGNSIGNAA